LIKTHAEKYFKPPKKFSAGERRRRARRIFLAGNFAAAIE